MSITKRYKVSFTFTHVLDSVDVEQLDRRVLEAARVVTGKLDVIDSPFNSYEFAKGFVLAALNGGRDAAAAYLVKYSIRDALKDSLKSGDGLKFSPATVREVH